MKKRIKKLKVFLDLQGQDGNWNYDPYMHGMYNGIEFAMAIMEKRDPNFKQEPKEWVSNKRDSNSGH